MRAKFLRLLLSFWLILGLFSFPITTGSAQEVSQAETLLARMTPAEEVGQLLLITLDGTEVSDTSAIYNLITN